jgi:hypothetical protein
MKRGVNYGKNSHVYVWWKAEERQNTLYLGLYGRSNGSANVSNVLGVYL